jgi:predicted  nucleic acid-binding Zn-ribbon protein
MPATTTKLEGEHSAKSPGKAPADYLKDALGDLDKAREKAGEEVSASIDSARERINDAREGLSNRSQDQVKDWREQLGSAADDALRELGRLAIRAQRSPDALTELSEEITKRKTEVSA